VPSSIPLTLVTGFLGAGKTTLVNHVLRASHGRRIAVVVNDFGDIAIDGDLVVGAATQTVSLENGCICCSIQADLVTGVAELVRNAPDLDAIVLETSGVSQPGAVISVLRGVATRPPLRIDSVVAVVDAEGFFGQRADRASGALVTSQLKAANTVVLNKADLVGEEALRATRVQIEEAVPGARVLAASNGAAPVELLLDTGLADRVLDGATEAGDAPRADAAFETWSFRCEEPLDAEAVKRAVWQLPPGIVRAKGILALSADRSVQTVLQLVGRRATLSTRANPSRSGLSRLVVIGTPGSVDPDALTRLFETTVAA
jgi:G3E family GTPase